jgi:HNH endonuclease
MNISTMERFERHTRKTDTCWIWTGAHNTQGYGGFSWKKDGYKMIRAHRASWIIYHGAIPNGMWVLHKCDNPSCVNPDHLFLGDCRVNTRDALIKGRLHVLPKGEKHCNAKLTADKVSAIRSEYAKGTMSMRKLGTRYGVSGNIICLIINRKTWAHV